MTTTANKEAKREKPIIFSAPMIRALLDGHKTQTRRIVKPKDHPDGMYFLDPELGVSRLYKLDESTPAGAQAWWMIGGINGAAQLCPHGDPGDRLWVRETFSGLHEYDIEKWPPSSWFEEGPIWYWADGNPSDGDWTKRKPSIYMPRWASRITLEIVSVRVERLQDISEEDVSAEGITPLRMVKGLLRKDWTPQRSYSELWESINGSGSWEANPFVWVISFKRLKP